MTTSTLDREIRARIEGFVSELSGLVKAAAVESVQQALGAGGTTAGRPARARAKTRLVVARAKPGKRGRRPSEIVSKTAELVLAYVKAHQGQRLEEIGRGLKVDTKELKRPVANLMAAKELRTQGQKRGTRYFAGGAASKAPSQAKRAAPKAAKKRKLMSAEQKAALLERLAKARAAKKAGAR